MDFSDALRRLLAGSPVARSGWNGKDMFVYFVPANRYPAQTGVARDFFGPEALVEYTGYFAIKSVDGTVTPWVPSQTDLQAQDWLVVEAWDGNVAPLA